MGIGKAKAKKFAEMVEIKQWVDFMAWHCMRRQMYQDDHAAMDSQ